MSISLLSENFDFRNATYALRVQNDKGGLMVTVEQTVYQLDGTKEHASITFPAPVLDKVNNMLERMAEAKRKEAEAKDPSVPMNQRDKLAKAYLQGVSISNLSRSYGYSAKAIIAMLKAAGLYVRE